MISFEWKPAKGNTEAGLAIYKLGSYEFHLAKSSYNSAFATHQAILFFFNEGKRAGKQVMYEAILASLNSEMRKRPGSESETTATPIIDHY